MRKSVILISFFALALLSAVTGRAAAAAPLPPMRIWGEFMIDGSPAADGSVLRALIEDAEYASATIFSDEGREGLFVIDIPADDPNTQDVIEGAQSGQMITFTSDDVWIEQTAVWESGDAINLDLRGGSTTSPVANFVCDPRVGPSPLTVSCTDISTGNPTAWQWAFGDGARSTMQNPTYTYRSSGGYDVELTVSNAENTDRLIRPHHILVYSPTPTSTSSGGFQLTVTPTPITTATPSATMEATLTGVGAATDTPAPTQTAINPVTATATATATVSDTPTETATPSFTLTSTFTFSEPIYLPVVAQNQ